MAKKSAKAATKTETKPVAKSAKAEPKAAAKKPAKESPKEKAPTVAKKAKPEAAVKSAVPAKPVVEAAATVAPPEPKVTPAAEKPKKMRKKALAAVLAGAADQLEKWHQMKEKFGKDKAVPYAMSATFEIQTPIQHKTLGWGFVLSNQNDRLEVLFESGIKMLISNYKP